MIGFGSVKFILLELEYCNETGTLYDESGDTQPWTGNIPADSAK
jgi:hypothetical protein